VWTIDHTIFMYIYIAIAFLSPSSEFIDYSVRR